MTRRSRLPNRHVVGLLQPVRVLPAMRPQQNPSGVPLRPRVPKVPNEWQQHPQKSPQRSVPVRRRRQPKAPAPSVRASPRPKHPHRSVPKNRRPRVPQLPPCGRPPQRHRGASTARWNNRCPRTFLQAMNGSTTVDCLQGGVPCGRLSPNG